MLLVHYAGVDGDCPLSGISPGRGSDDPCRLLALCWSAGTSALTVAIGGQTDEEWTPFKRRD